MADTVFDRESARVRRFLSSTESLARDGERTLAEKAGAVLRDFEDQLRQLGVPPRAITPARYALAVLIDQSVRSVSRVRISAWLAAAHVHLFDRREVTIDSIRRFRDTAISEGHDYDELAKFLQNIVAELEDTRRTREKISRKPALYLALATGGLIVALAMYAGFLDYRYHAGLIASFETERSALPQDDLDDYLGQLADLSFQVSRASASAPLAQLVTIPFWTSGERATQVYSDEVNATLPAAIRTAIGEALATEGEDLAQYDTLRTWAILTGMSDWSPAYLAGWLEARDATLATGPLARHVARLQGPVPTLSAPDRELLDQALGFAAEASEQDRAFLELTRLDDIRALSQWDPAAAIPDLTDVLVRRSGRPLADGLPQIFTEDGWNYSQSIGVGVAVQKARTEAAKLFPFPLQTRNDTPDLVLETLQDETLRHWKSWLADLRVRPFSDQDSAIRISGALSQRNSPLEALFQEVWTQVGGRDRKRPHELQIRIASAFGPAIQYFEQGKILEIRGLFAALNVALGAIEFNEEQGAEQLMNVQELARSVSALQAAPTLVAQIAEDVLAQTSAAHSSLLTNPLTREWQQSVYPICQRVVEGHYPFQNGDDSSIAGFAELFGPQGAMTRFVAGYADRYLDTSDETWRWKPEARLAGVNQDSARFLQDAMVVSGAFFEGRGELGRQFDIAALAEKGEATIVIGGAGTSLRATGASQRLAWPGPDPLLGAEVAFRQGSESMRVSHQGPWGFLRLLDETRIRHREKGQRHLVDLRTEGGRLFFEISFKEPLNPVSVRSLANGMTCPPVL